MGACVSESTNVEEMIIRQISLMKISSLTVSEVRDILYSNSNSVNGFDLRKLSEESMNLYKRTLKNISKDSFDKIALEYFYEPYYSFQSSFFRLIHQASQSKRAFNFIYLIPLTRGSNEDKMSSFIDSFFSLINQTQQNYADIKIIVADYIKNILTIPFLSLRETIDDISLQESIDSMIKQVYNEDKIAQFTDYLFRSFEQRINAEYDNYDSSQLSTLSRDDLEELIENHKNFIFDYQLLKETFNKKIS